MTDESWREIIKKAEAYKAIGQTDIHLFRAPEYPWGQVTEVKEGSTWRFNQPVSVSFSASIVNLSRPIIVSCTWTLVNVPVSSKNVSGAPDTC